MTSNTVGNERMCGNLHFREGLQQLLGLAKAVEPSYRTAQSDRGFARNESSTITRCKCTNGKRWRPPDPPPYRPTLIAPHPAKVRRLGTNRRPTKVNGVLRVETVVQFTLNWIGVDSQSSLVTQMDSSRLVVVKSPWFVHKFLLRAHRRKCHYLRHSIQ